MIAVGYRAFPAFCRRIKSGMPCPNSTKFVGNVMQLTRTRKEPRIK
jgi:hypothetical protein